MFISDEYEKLSELRRNHMAKHIEAIRQYEASRQRLKELDDGCKREWDKLVDESICRTNKT